MIRLALHDGAITRLAVSRDGSRAVTHGDDGLLVLWALPGAPEVTELEIPEDLLASGDEIKFQILATDLGGNETSSESCFRVR